MDLENASDKMGDSLEHEVYYKLALYSPSTFCFHRDRVPTVP